MTSKNKMVKAQLSVSDPQCGELLRAFRNNVAVPYEGQSHVVVSYATSGNRFFGLPHFTFNLVPAPYQTGGIVKPDSVFNIHSYSDEIIPPTFFGRKACADETEVSRAIAAARTDPCRAKFPSSIIWSKEPSMPDRVPNKRLDPWLSWINPCKVTETGISAPPTCKEIGQLAREVKASRDEKPKRLMPTRHAIQGMCYESSADLNRIAAWVSGNGALIDGRLFVDGCRVMSGDWVVKSSTGVFNVLSGKNFHDQYEVQDD